MSVPEQWFKFLQQNAHLTVGEVFGVPSAGRIESASESASSRKRQAKTDLRHLMQVGLLSQGQVVFLHDYQGRRIAGIQAEVGPSNKLTYRGNRYSMSGLATKLLEDRGFTSEAVRGPAHWYTEAGESLRSAWERHQRSTGS